MVQQVSDEELMGRNQYARHANVTPAAVLKAARDGRITRAVIWKGGRIEAIQWRLADKLWKANTDPERALRTRTPAAMSGKPEAQAAPAAPGRTDVCTARSPRSRLHEISELLCTAFANSIIPWCAMTFQRHRGQITADMALNLVEDLLLVLNESAVIALGIPDPEGRCEMFVPEMLVSAMNPTNRPRILEEIEAMAQQYEFIAPTDGSTSH